MKHRALFCCAGALRTEVFVVAADAAGELVTMEFYEPRPGEPAILFMKSAGWGTPLQPGVEVLGAWSGHRRNRTEMIWIGWRDAAAVHALSVYQENAIPLPLAPGDVVIEPAMTMFDRTLHLYLVRGGTLLRYVATGELDQRPRVRLESLEDASAPLLAAAAPVLEHPDGGAVVASVVAEEGGCRVHAFRASTAGVQEKASVFVAGWLPLPQSRMAVHPADVASCAFVAEKDGGAAYAMLELRFDFASGQIDLRDTAVALEPQVARAAASCFLQRPEEAIATSWVHARDGRLLRVTPGDTALLRIEPDETYDFPIVTTREAAFEAFGGADGESFLWRPA